MPNQWDLTPNLSSNVAQQGVADAAGGLAYTGVADAESAGEIAFGGPTADFILYGVVNGAFAQGPPNPAANIEPVNNPLPYWSGPVQTSGGAITAKWVTDASSPSGYNLRFTVNAGAASDAAYFEQIIPVGGTRWRWLAHTIRATFYRVTASDNGFVGYVSGQYLTAAGATTGGAFSTSATATWTADATADTAATAAADSNPVDAAFLRIRINIARDAAAATATGTFDVTDVRTQRAQDALLLGDINGAGGYAQLIVAGDVASWTGLTSYQGPVFRTSDRFELAEVSAPGTPDSGYYSVYAMSDGRLYGKNDAGVIHKLPPQIESASGTSGSLAAGAGGNVTITWPTAFADTNYKVALSTQLNDGTNRTPPTAYVKLDGANAPSTTRIIVRVLNNAAVNEDITVNAIAIHD